MHFHSSFHVRCPAGKIKLHVRPSSQSVPKSGTSPASTPRAPTPVGAVRAPVPQATTMAAATTNLHGGGMRLQLVQQGGTIKGKFWNYSNVHECLALMV